MKLKHVVTGVALVVSGLSAQAADLNIDVGSDPMNYGSFVTKTESFYDVFSFSLTQASFVDASVVAVGVGGFKTNSAWSIVDSDNTIVAGLYTINSNANAFLTLGVGTYSLEVNGKPSGGSAKYLVGINVSPVPEPETYAMMLAGLVAVGFLARRRQG